MLVTKKAPNFIADAVSPSNKIIKNFNFEENIQKKKTLLFFWPLDFTFVCPSELIAFNNKQQEFEKRNIKLIGVSIDSIYAHMAWKNTTPEKGGIGQVKFIMVSDINKEIQKLYHVEHPELNIALRATFLIDKTGIIRYQSINDLPLGRNINEIIRIIDALDHHEKNGEVCPAQWNIHKKAIKPSHKGVKKYFKYNIKDLK